MRRVVFSEVGTPGIQAANRRTWSLVTRSFVMVPLRTKEVTGYMSRTLLQGLLGGWSIASLPFVTQGWRAAATRGGGALTPSVPLLSVAGGPVCVPSVLDQAFPRAFIGVCLCVHVCACVWVCACVCACLRACVRVHACLYVSADRRVPQPLSTAVNRC